MHAIEENAALASGPEAAKDTTVTVWDPLVRIFHWSLVALLVLAFATGDESERVHIVAGYGIMALIAFRLLWGLVGSQHARFTDFVRGPASVLAYLRDTASGRARRYLGHNPAGGMMIVALLVMLAATGASGYMMTTPTYWHVKWVEELHEVTANLTLGLVVLHVAGVLVSSFAHRENLILAMITGRKRADGMAASDNKNA